MKKLPYLSGTKQTSFSSDLKGIILQKSKFSVLQLLCIFVLIHHYNLPTLLFLHSALSLHSPTFSLLIFLLLYSSLFFCILLYSSLFFYFLLYFTCVISTDPTWSRFQRISMEVSASSPNKNEVKRWSS